MSLLGRHPWLSITALAAGGISGHLLFKGARGLFPFIGRTIVFLVLWPILLVWALIAFIGWLIDDSKTSWLRMHNAVIAHAQVFVYWYEGLRPLSAAEKRRFLEPRFQWVATYIPRR